jgi:hypothetical protein
MIAIYKQKDKEWVLSTVFACNVAGDMWREWFEADGNLTRTKIVRSVSELTDTLEETEIEDPATVLGSFHM